MRIVNLIENTPGAPGCLYEHGLSFYVETENHKLLIDTGAGDAFLNNARVLGIDLTQVDTLVLSHGHYDHAGGILPFVKINPTAKIYMQKTATGDFYHVKEKMESYIGIDKTIATLPQIIFLNGNYVIDDELSIFSNVTDRQLWPKSNQELMEMVDGQFFQDEFSHEQYLVISNGDERVLVSGCAHNGILNIIEKYRVLHDANPDMVISGFHMEQDHYTQEDIAVIDEIAKKLSNTDIVFYTGHCTGAYPFERMKNILGNQLVYVHSGDELR